MYPVKKSLEATNIYFEDILFFFIKYLKFFILSAILAGILGVALSFLSTKIYQSKITLLPEYGSTKKNSLALLAGVSAEGAEKLLPELYPTILESTPFGIHLLEQPVKDKDGKQFPTFKTYLKRDSTSKPLLSFLSFGNKAAKTEEVDIKDPDILQLSSEENGLVKAAISLVSSSIDAKLGVVTILVKSDDPYVSSILAEASKKYLIDYVEDYRTAKAIQQAKLLKEQVVAAKIRMEKAEYTLQNYRDNNRNSFLNVAKIEEQRHQSEFLLATSLYDNLVRKYEEANLKIKEEKPVFKVLEPAKITLNKVSPKRLTWGIVFSFLGVFFCFVYLFVFKEGYFRTLLKTTQNKDNPTMSELL